MSDSCSCVLVELLSSMLPDLDETSTNTDSSEEEISTTPDVLEEEEIVSIEGTVEPSEGTGVSVDSADSEGIGVRAIVISSWSEPSISESSIVLSLLLAAWSVVIFFHEPFLTGNSLVTFTVSIG